MEALAYIEYRVYLRNSFVERSDEDVEEIAEQLKDKIADFVSESDECAPYIFNGDVTYEFKMVKFPPGHVLKAEDILPD